MVFLVDKHCACFVNMIAGFFGKGILIGDEFRGHKKTLGTQKESGE